METKSVKTRSIKTDTKEKRGRGMEKLYFLLLALELIYEMLRTTPFPEYAETAAAGMLHFWTDPGAQSGA